MESIKLTRKELFDLVWSTPMTKLAAKYGISDVALRKKCHKHQIPTPGLGHWAKVAAGHKVTKPHLGKRSGAGDEIVLQPFPAAAASNNGPQVPVVVVPDTLKEPHEAVTFLKNRLEGRSR